MWDCGVIGTVYTILYIFFCFFFIPTVNQNPMLLFLWTFYYVKFNEMRKKCWNRVTRFWRCEEGIDVLQELCERVKRHLVGFIPMTSFV